jgi:hypothetical protein
MANTRLLKTQVEPFVREWLSEQFRQKFTSNFLPLTGCSGSHEFDAVSVDKRIVCGIKSSSGVTSGGKNPSGKIAGACEEIYFLASVDADQRFLILTDQEFYQVLSEKMRDKLTHGIALKYCQLNEELSQLVKKIQSGASSEIDRGKLSYRARDAGR